MAANAPFATGRRITACTLTPQSVNATTGALSDTTPVQTLYGHLAEAEWTSRVTTENISPMNSLLENHVYVEVGTQWRLVEHVKYGVSGTPEPSLLAAAAYGPDSLFKLALVRGGRTATAYVQMTEYNERATKARITAEATFLTIDPNGTTAGGVTSGTANPAYA